MSRFLRAARPARRPLALVLGSIASPLANLRRVTLVLANGRPVRPLAPPR